MMSAQSEIHTFLAQVAKGSSGDFVPMDPGEVARQTGIARNMVNKTLFNLTSTGKLELKRGENGRSIVGFKVLAQPGEARRQPRVNGTAMHRPTVMQGGMTARKLRRTVQTPHVDQYASAKDRFESMRSELGPLIDAKFNEDPMAEEALMLRARLDQIEGGWNEMAEELAITKRDLESLRRSSRRELAEAVSRSGATVQHGD